jgi:hypothetical protein
MWNIAVITFSTSPRRSLDAAVEEEMPAFVRCKSHIIYMITVDPFYHAPNDLSMLRACRVIEVCIISDPMPFEVTGERSHRHSPLYKGTPLCAHA